jgi:hypothetical protein
VQQIVNAQLLELKHHRTEVGTEDLWVRLRLQILLEGLHTVRKDCVSTPARRTTSTPDTPHYRKKGKTKMFGLSTISESRGGETA